ncbi:MAG: helix-hairpin-helix domain-containing protein [Terriglobia bacterium]
MLLEELKTRILEICNAVTGQFSRGQAIAIVLLSVVLVGVGLLLYVRDRPVPVEIGRAEGETASARGGRMKRAKIFVHVGGAVEKPGVYELTGDSRIYEAIKKAGGEAADADIDAVNLAAKLKDGQKIYLPKEGELGASDGPRPSGGGVRPPTYQFGEPLLLNVNTASQEQLEELPGVGPVIAERIIAHREKTLFESVSDLREVEGIGPKKFAQIEDRVGVE